MAIFITPGGGGGTPGGSSGQIQFNDAGAFGGLSTFTTDGSGNITLSGRLTNSYSSILDNPAKRWTGTWVNTGGTATTTKPHVLIEPAGTTSTGWSTNGTALGINGVSSFVGNLIDAQINGTSIFKVSNNNATIRDLTVNLSIGCSTFACSGDGRFGQVFLDGDSRTWNVLALRSRNTFGQVGTGAVAFRIYGTGGVGSTTFERANIGWDAGSAAAVFTGSISSTTLTVTSVTSGTIEVGHILNYSGINPGIRITALGTGTGGTGTYTLGQDSTTTSVAMTSGPPVLRIGTEKGSVGGTARGLELQTDNVTRLQISRDGYLRRLQPAPAAVNTTATLTIANIQSGIVTTTTAAAVDMTLPTGTNVEGGFAVNSNDLTFEWSVINTGSNAATIIANTDHTIVGAAAVAAGTSGRFATRRTAANTYVTYRLV